ncbi:MAG: HNH endonuclease [Polyangiaceae bacterium]|nr:HNH endonuclease [Polyangiaceae bacterium]
MHESQHQRQHQGHYHRDYEPALPTRELIERVRALLTDQRRAERLLCRYLADLAERVRGRSDPELGAYADELHAARCCFGLGVRQTRERLRVGFALRTLPAIERAFVEGDLSYSRVREVTRVATTETELAWLELAQRLDMRALERRVAGVEEAARMAAGASAASAAASVGAAPAASVSASPATSVGGTLALGAGARGDGHARAEWRTPSCVRVTVELSAEAWALLERAMQGARDASGGGMSDGDALEALARDALAEQSRGSDAAEPRRAVVLYECARCQSSELDTRAGGVELAPAAAAALGCGAHEHDLRVTERAAEATSATLGNVEPRGGPMPAGVRRAVLLRDRATCRVPGCHRRRYVDVHHLRAQSRGGEHSRRNCVCLCTTHHLLLHEGKLRIEGNADVAASLRFFDVHGELTAAPLGCPVTQGGSSPGAVTQGGSWDGAAKQCDAVTQGGSSPDAVTQGGSWGAEAGARLLRVMARRGGWTTDGLVDASGLPVPAVSATLVALQLEARVRVRRGCFEVATGHG